MNDLEQGDNIVTQETDIFDILAELNDMLTLIEMTNHIVVKHSETSYVAQGIGSYFWWNLDKECGEWVISSIWGLVYKRVPSLAAAIKWIENLDEIS